MLKQMHVKRQKPFTLRLEKTFRPNDRHRTPCGLTAKKEEAFKQKPVNRESV